MLKWVCTACNGISLWTNHHCKPRGACISVHSGILVHPMQRERENASNDSLSGSKCLSLSVSPLLCTFCFTLTRKQSTTNCRGQCLTCHCMYACICACTLSLCLAYRSNGVIKILKDGLLDLNAMLLPIKEGYNEMKEIALSHVIGRLLFKLSWCNIVWSRPVYVWEGYMNEKVGCQSQCSNANYWPQQPPNPIYFIGQL